MRILLILVVMLASCTTYEVNMDNITEKEFQDIPCKFEIVDVMDTAKYQYAISLWTIEEAPIEIKSYKLNNLQQNTFVAWVMSTGVDVLLSVWETPAMNLVFVSDTAFDETMIAYDWGDGTNGKIYPLKKLQKFNPNRNNTSRSLDFYDDLRTRLLLNKLETLEQLK